MWQQVTVLFVGLSLKGLQHLRLYCKKKRTNIKMMDILAMVVNFEVRGCMFTVPSNAKIQPQSYKASFPSLNLHVSFRGS